MIEDSALIEVTTTLQDLSQQKILILREVMLPLSLGSYPRWVMKMVRFAVKLKFFTPEGTGEERGDWSITLECHHIAWKEEPQVWDLEIWNELLTPAEVGLLQEEDYLEEPQKEEDFIVRWLKEEPKLEAVEQNKLVVLDPNDEIRTV
ncbi:hypothetical protein DH2020_037984 [Rehmannia glutinosa]|uniref:Uncharacterized protein n=1 Tax=Rehmannia glutinosa TaxID=99300 RepID=A0ABR0V061_REHGL